MEGLSRDEREVYANLVTPGWFDTLGTRLIAGRDVDARDRFGAPRVAVVNEAFARKFFGGANPVGQVIRGGWPDPQENTDPLEIVGLVEDAVYRSIKEPVPETVYQPIAQLADEDVEAFALGLVLIARPATTTPTQISRGVAAAIVDVDPEVSLTMRPLEVQVRSTFNNERVLALLAAVFAVLALLLVAVGIYGVISHAVTRRQAEIGLRLALGAARGAVVRLVVGRVTSRVVGGLVLGALVSFWAARFIESLLFGVTAGDLRTLGGAAVILLTVASAAALVPARRATKVDPAQALRQEYPSRRRSWLDADKHRTKKQPLTDAGQHRLAFAASLDVGLVTLLGAQVVFPSRRRLEEPFARGSKEARRIPHPDITKAGRLRQAVRRADHLGGSQLACPRLITGAQPLRRVDEVAGEAPARLHDPMALSQHGELVGDSTEHVRVHDGVEGRRTKRQPAAIGRYDVRPTAECATTDMGLCLTQRVQRHVTEDDIAWMPPRDLHTGPTVSTPDIQEPLAGQHANDVAQRLSLGERRVSVQTDLMTQHGALNAPRCVAVRPSVVLEEVGAVHVVGRQWHAVPCIHSKPAKNRWPASYQGGV